MASECSLPFAGRHPGFVIETGKFQGASISPSVVQSSRVALGATRKTIGPHVLRKPCWKPCFGLWRGLRQPTRPEIHLFGVYLCARGGQACGEAELESRTIKSRGTGFESPFFYAHCCDMSRAVPDGRGHSVRRSKLIYLVKPHTKYVRVGATLHRGGGGGDVCASPICRAMRIKPGFVAFSCHR